MSWAPDKTKSLVCQTCALYRCPSNHDHGDWCSTCPCIRDTRKHDGEQTPIEDKLREGATVLDEPFHHDAIANDMLLAADEITQLRQQRSAMEQERDAWKKEPCTDHPRAAWDLACTECLEASFDEAIQQATRAGFEAGIRVRSVNFRSIDEAFAASFQQQSSPRPDHGEGS